MSVLKVLNKEYSKEVFLTSLDQLALDTCTEFKSNFPQFHGLLIPDGTSLVLHNPLRNGKTYYTVCKGHNSLRYFILVNSLGRIVSSQLRYDG